MPDAENLLPSSRKRAVRQLYTLRRTSVAALLLAGVVAVHGLFLLPAYLTLAHDVREQETALALSDARPSERTLRIRQVAGDAAYLAELGTQAKAAPSISAIAEAPHAGVSIRSVSFMPGEEGSRIEVAGVAATREALRAYEAALESLPQVTSVEVPVGAYAAERDIAFSLTVSGPLSP
jgi:Tfp pilus assembly protein PilN